MTPYTADSSYIGFVDPIISKRETSDLILRLCLHGSPLNVSFAPLLVSGPQNREPATYSTFLSYWYWKIAIVPIFLNFNFRGQDKVLILIETPLGKVEVKCSCIEVVRYNAFPILGIAP